MTQTWKQEIENKRGAIRVFMNEQSIDISSKFVPFSQSRNKDEKTKTLNWRITLVRNTRVLLSTDYSAGIAHCPSYNVLPPPNWDRHPKDWQHFACEFECENGAKAAYHFSQFSGRKDHAVKPLDIDVLYSLVSDADVLNYSSFEEWADNFGYDVDSRSAEKTYRACLEIALQLRNGLGEDILSKLQTLFQDY